jgi:hypothetical protein
MQSARFSVKWNVSVLHQFCGAVLLPAGLLCSGSGSAVAAELSKSKDYGCAGEDAILPPLTL